MMNDGGDRRSEIPGAPGVPEEAQGVGKTLDSLGFVMDVPVEVTIEIGRRTMKISELLRVAPGSVIELDKASGEPLDVYVNNRRIARGEAVVIGDRYGVRLTEVLVGDEARAGGVE